MLYEGKLIWQGRTADIDHSGDAHVDQFIHGRAEGPLACRCGALTMDRQPSLAQPDAGSTRSCAIGLFWTSA